MLIYGCPRLAVNAHNIFRDKGTPRVFADVVVGVFVGVGAFRCRDFLSVLFSGNFRIAGAYGFTKASVLFVVSETDNALFQFAAQFVGDVDALHILQDSMVTYGCPLLTFGYCLRLRGVGFLVSVPIQ